MPFTTTVMEWLVKALEESNSANGTSCCWDNTGDDTWETYCGKSFVLIDGTPSKNDMHFCCYCGARITEVPYVEPPIEDDAE